jgi:cell division septum initiation protein DivIVA
MSIDDDEFDEVETEEDYELPNPYAVPEVEALLDEAIEMLAESRPLPMSNTVKVNRDELLHLLEQVQDQLPEEVRAARWLLKEREEFIAKARREHQALIDEGRAQVSRMVERQQVVKEAEARARKILDNAQQEATTMKRQVEEYCDRKLARFEAVLTQTTEVVQRGRQRLVGLSDVAGARTDDWATDDGWPRNGNHDQAEVDLRDSVDEYESDLSP